MNLLADEGVDRQIVERLRQEGYSVLYIAEMDPGISDDQVLEKANQAEALLLTADKDFGELVFRLHRVTSGIVLLRLAGASPVQKAEIVALVFKEHGAELRDSFAVVTTKAVRIRKNR